MLSVKNLHASVDGKEILRGIDLEVKAGEVHAVMGITSCPTWCMCSTGDALSIRATRRWLSNSKRRATTG